MSSPLKISVEWKEADGVREEALARTFARLEIRVDGHCVTKAFDRRTRAVQEGVLVSLLPLAAWIADAWWTASFELPHGSTIRSVRDARTPEARDWHRRHGWLSSREGFCFPELVFSRGDGEGVRLDWFQEPDTFDAMPLRFLNGNSAVVPLDIVQVELGRLVEGVLARCEGISNPIVDQLRHRWNLLLSATKDERLVCERAARLGLDAYVQQEVDDELAELLARPDMVVSDPILNDLLDAADDISVPKLEKQISRFGALLKEAAERSVPGEELQLESTRLRMTSPQGHPFEWGYERARVVRRDILGLSDDVVASALDAAIESSLLPPWGVTEDAGAFMFHGVHALATTVGGAPFVVTRPRLRLGGRRFDRARALYSLISSERPHLVTAAADAEQQASRAFAAELLVPERDLRSRLTSRYVDSDDIEDLAAEFKVDTMLIRHQLENHHLAILVDP